jgi:hypothetical protein
MEKTYPCFIVSGAKLRKIAKATYIPHGVINMITKAFAQYIWPIGIDASKA